MWRLKNLMHGGNTKDQPVLEGKTVEVGQMKLHVRNAIAEGGFSCVYLVKDTATQKQYAMKHIICNDMESLALVKKEVAVMKALKGHPNVVTLHAQTVYDLGRTKECFLVMDFCERMLVNVLDARGNAGFFEEKQILAIFRDVCNGVYAMHHQSPPIAHRDLKAENVLMGADGLWKLCDFGSTTTNHKRFERPEEMGIEEDIIRKHTTPAYRSPEMWDLYRRELISERVDIWAVGCLLYRIAYLKSAFDGESKLQILNGNYRIPELPKYSSSLVQLIKDMLTSPPEDRPDIMQIWYRVNELLPADMRKSRPDGPAPSISSDHISPALDSRDHGASTSLRRTSPVPSRSPPPPPVTKDPQGLSPSRGQSDPKIPHNSGNVDSSLGAFWSTQFAQESVAVDSGPVFDSEPGSETSSKQRIHSPETYRTPTIPSPSSQESNSKSGGSAKRIGMSVRQPQISPQSASRAKKEERSSDLHKTVHGSEANPVVCNYQSDVKVSSGNAYTPGSGGGFADSSFNTFVADFDHSRLNVPGKDSIELEMDKLREEVEQLRTEKAEIAAKYEKLTAICRSQRQEIQELKQSLSGTSQNFMPFGNESSSKSSIGQQTLVGSAATSAQNPKEGSIWELHEGLTSNTWQPFPDSNASQNLKASSSNSKQSSEAQSSGHRNHEFVTPSNGYRREQGGGTTFNSNDSWGFGQDSFTASQTHKSPGQVGSFGEIKANPNVISGNNAKSRGQSSQAIAQSQPVGWAGF